MLVIPLSFVIMLLACVLLFVSFIPFIAKLIALVLGMSVKLLNYCVVSIEELPYSVTSNIYINFEQLVLLFIFLSFIVLFFVYRRVRLLYVAILSLAVIFVISSIHNYQISRQNYFVVFNSKGNPAYNFLDGRSNVLLADSALLNNPKRLAYLAGSFWISRGVTAIDTFNIRTLYQNNAETIHPLKNNLYRWQANQDWLLGNHFITYRNRKFLFIRNDLLAGMQQMQKTPIDYVILSNNSKLEITDLLSFVTPRLVIVDSSNSTNRKNKWKLDCSNNGINYYVVSEKGAFIAKL